MGILLISRELAFAGLPNIPGLRMLKDSTGERADKEAIVQAVKALMARGCDVNAYTVAAELNVPRSDIVNNAEIMELLAQARERTSPNGLPTVTQNTESAVSTSNDGENKLNRRLEQLEIDHEALTREVEQARWDNQILRKQLEEAQAENQKLRDYAARLQSEAEQISKSVNIAWQQGYLAGQQAAMSEPVPQKSFVESLAEAARAATKYGGTDESSTGIPPVATATVETPEGAPYVAEVPLQFDDPEVLNDPFTAKLMSALQGDQVETTPLEALTEEDLEEALPEPSRTEDDHGLSREEIERWAEAQGIPPEKREALIRAAQDERFMRAARSKLNEARANAQAQHGYIDEAEGQRDTVPMAEAMSRPQQIPGMDGMRPRESTDQFTAEELHNLFRNRYVREGDPPEVQREVKASPEISQPTKKFVGGKHATSSTEPMPAIPRVFPPDIRKACKLLGVQPEELSRQTVLDAWKKEMSKPGVHPDTGGDTEMAIYLNTAKDTLMRWIEAQTPKLGKKFGAQQQPNTKTSETPKPGNKPE
jgi:hypothetical protein